jgi:REP element-mobilizing transposase RayT
MRRRLWYPRPKRGFTRGYLTHHDFPWKTVGVTFRLADSLPVRLLRAYSAFLRTPGAPRDVAAQRVRSHIETYLGKGKGDCVLRDPRVASIVEETLRSGDPHDYRLIAWVIMPNHVHVIIRRTSRSSLPEIVRGWKGSSARAINLLLNRTGALWFRDYYDRDISVEDEDALTRAVGYVDMNPVKAGLCRFPEDWPFSSARERRL